MRDESAPIPFWAIGIIGAAILIGISIFAQPVRTEMLRDQFARQPTPVLPLPGLPQLELQNLAPDIQIAAQEWWRQLAAGNRGQAIDPVVNNQRLRVEVTALEPIAGGIRVKGTVTNLGSTDLLVPISAFELRDSSGESYRAPGTSSVVLPPGGATPLELSVPLPTGRGLLLITHVPPDPPLEQRLLIDVQGARL